MTKCQRELLLDQAETYRHEMEKKQKESKFDINSAGELSDTNSSQSSPQSDYKLSNDHDQRLFKSMKERVLFQVTSNISALILSQFYSETRNELSQQEIQSAFRQTTLYSREHIGRFSICHFFLFLVKFRAALELTKIEHIVHGIYY